MTFLNILEGELQAGSYVNIEVCARGIQSAHLFEDSDLPERLRRGFDEFLKDLHGKNPSVIAENESEE